MVTSEFFKKVTNWQIFSVLTFLLKKNKKIIKLALVNNNLSTIFEQNVVYWKLLIYIHFNDIVKLVLKTVNLIKNYFY